MKFTRRALLGIIILTLASIFFNYFHTWRTRSRQVIKAPQILDSEMKRSAKDVEYFEYRGSPRALRFKIHANLLLETNAGKNLLEGIEACDFNPDGTVRNEIHSQRAEYDPIRKVADFSGDVRLFLNKQIELRTDSLHYDLNSEIGTTADLMRFYSEQIRGTARGIRYEQKQHSLVLQSDVDLTLMQKPGKAHSGKSGEVHATAQRAYCSELTGRVLLEGSARLISGAQTLSGAQIEAILDPAHKRISSLLASGDARYESKTPEDLRRLGGDRLVFGMGDSGVLQKVTVSGHASFSSASSSDIQNLRGGEIDMDLDAKELPVQIRAREDVSFRTTRGGEQISMSGDQLDASFAAGTKYLNSIRIRKQPANQARMHMKPKDAEESELQADDIRMSLRELNGHSVLEKLRAEGAARYLSTPARKDQNPEPARSLSASLIEMYQSANGDYLESGSASGKVVLSEDSASTAPGAQIKRLSADKAKFQFYPGKNALKHLSADGNVQTSYEKKTKTPPRSPGESFRTASEKLEAEFDAPDGKSVVKSVAQWGNFTYADGLRTASSGRCDYDAVKEILVLTDSPKISDETKSTTGNRIEYEQGGKLLSVHGRVRTVFSSQKSDGSLFVSSSSSSPGVVMADEMRYWTESGRIRYLANVHLLSENQDLRADTLEISNGLERVDADGSVRHLISRKEPARGDKTSRESAADLLTVVQSSAMSYLKEKNRLSYSGKVALHSKDADLTSDVLDAIPDSDGKKIQQATARGNVVVHYGARVCKGDAADYSPETRKLVVTGKPAEFYDPEKGRSFARRLTSSTADDTIQLEK